MQGLPLPGPQIHALPAPKRKPTGYIADLDKGIDYHWIPDKYKNVSELVEIKNDADRLHELRKARDMAAIEARNYGNKARGVERRLQNEETEEEKTLYLNTKENLQKYYKNMILLILLVKDMIQKKKKYSNLSKVVFKTLTDLSGLENKKRSKKFKNIIKGGCIPTFYNDPKDLLSLLELIIGMIDAGNDNSKMKNRGMAILVELLKLGAISKDQHEKIYKGYLI